MLVPIESSSALLVMMCSNCVYLQPFSRYIRVNNAKDAIFRRYPSLTPSFVGNPLTQRHNLGCQKTRRMRLPCGEIRLPISPSVWTQSTSVTDGRTDGQNAHSKYRALHKRRAVKSIKVSTKCMPIGSTATNSLPLLL